MSVGPEGLEPPTTWFEARCSIQLSYGPAKKLQPGSGCRTHRIVHYAVASRHPGTTALDAPPPDTSLKGSAVTRRQRAASIAIAEVDDHSNRRPRDKNHLSLQ